ncbi:MAG TPA: hypothetical protein VKK79_13140 [Candidatus Lokiarchaeia archaeon]|nr:hypothetical protein [Candidatus Lokiarchaeia archaeon]
MNKNQRIVSFSIFIFVAALFVQFVVDLLYGLLGSYISDFWGLFLIALVAGAIGGPLLATHYGNRTMQEKFADDASAEIHLGEKRLRSKQAE